MRIIKIIDGKVLAELLPTIYQMNKKGVNLKKIASSIDSHPATVKGWLENYELYLEGKVFRLITRAIPYLKNAETESKAKDDCKKPEIKDFPKCSNQIISVVNARQYRKSANRFRHQCQIPTDIATSSTLRVIDYVNQNLPINQLVDYIDRDDYTLYHHEGNYYVQVTVAIYL
jgi:hypothetical protein